MIFYYPLTFPSSVRYMRCVGLLYGGEIWEILEKNSGDTRVFNRKFIGNIRVCPQLRVI